MEKKVLAMYDVRGIQNYIFRTAKVRDAIGASAIVETIIQDALQEAVDRENERNLIKCELEWCSTEGPLAYTEEDYDVQVLYIGGGNAYVTYSSRELCIRINRRMAKYTIDHTYSLQLAAAIVDKTEDYNQDYQNLFEEMARVKSNMSVSKPLGALPVMDIDVKTGYPVTAVINGVKESTESLQKKQREKQVREDVKTQERILDSYITEKGVDSTIAVVHIDGNNMGLRIRRLISGIRTYGEAVAMMRKISFHINASYKQVFEEMADHFNKNAGKQEVFSRKETQNFVLKILVAGDDITYVCNGKIALETVRRYCEQIAGHTMTGITDEASIRDYGFSVCAGIAFIGSHFPFYAAYETAEACCESAKDRAKSEGCREGERIGNWVDFQICKNIQARDLKKMRKREYQTSSGEELLLRPYFVGTGADNGAETFTRIGKSIYTLASLKRAIQYFQDGKKIPMSFAKTLRNVYPLGEIRVKQFYAFLESRDWKLPEGDTDLYTSEHADGSRLERKRARWYDALEMMDLFIELEGKGNE